MFPFDWLRQWRLLDRFICSGKTNSELTPVAGRNQIFSDTLIWMFSKIAPRRLRCPQPEQRLSPSKSYRSAGA